MARDHFLIPENQVYLCGHSLGPMSHLSLQRVRAALHEWNQHAVLAWHSQNWIELPHTLASKIAGLIGASANSVAVCDSTSVNLYKALRAALHLNADRKIIVTSDDNFPTDLYIASGLPDIQVKRISSLQIMEALTDQVAVLLLSHVNYRDASVFDMAKITKLAHEKGIIVVFDLSHSVGILQLSLEACNVDFAVGCTYKYLKGGPGSPAFLYVHPRHHLKIQNPILGWMGHADPFAFSPNYAPMPDAKQFMVGTPGILSYAALDGALDCMQNRDWISHELQRQQHVTYLKESFLELGLTCFTQMNSAGHVAFVHEDGQKIANALIAVGIIVDNRGPNLVRLCIDPHYLTLRDLEYCVHHLQIILRGFSK